MQIIFNFTSNYVPKLAFINANLRTSLKMSTVTKIGQLMSLGLLLGYKLSERFLSEFLDEVRKNNLKNSSEIEKPFTFKDLQLFATVLFNTVEIRFPNFLTIIGKDR